MATPEVVKTASEIWKTVAGKLSQTDEREYGSPELAKAASMNMPAAGRALRFFRGLGILEYRSEYGTGAGGGQRVLAKITVSLDDGLTAIYKHFDAGRTYSWFEAGNPGGTPKQIGVGKGHHDWDASKEVALRASQPGAKVRADAVVVADERSTEEVRAIAGPEPEKPLAPLRAVRKDEPEALIEAARQYANRTSEVTAHIEALKDLGVEVDMDRVMSGISLTNDPILETVSTLVPYIDRLQMRVDRLTETSGIDKSALTELRREVGVVTKERNDLKEANRRLSERNVKLQAATVQAQA